MRLRTSTIQIRTGNVLVCDPLVIGDDASDQIDDRVRFRSWNGDGSFSVYSDGDCFFIDIDPRIFKAGTRSNLAELPGHVGVDTAEIGIYDLTAERFAAADDAIAEGWAVVISDLPPGPYVAWFEEKGTAKELFRGVIGFGRNVKMILNSGSGALIQELEDRIAKAYRLKGNDKQAEMEAIRNGLADLHLSGCNDQRLRMLASAVKFELPRRPPRRR